jgi:hypothetical protein
MSYTRPDFDAADATFGPTAYTLPANIDADATWYTGDPFGVISDGGLPSPPEIIGYTAAYLGYIADVSLLGQPYLLSHNISGQLVVDTMLGLAEVLTFHDFTNQIADTPITYVVDLVTPSGLLRLPVSSWQATLQVGSECYAGCVIPAAGDYVDQIGEATHFVVSRCTQTLAGDVLEDERVRSPITSAPTFDQGPTNYTVSLQGHFDEIPEDLAPHARYDRALLGVRSISTYGSGQRFRCAIDWLLRPAQRASYDATTFVVAFINYYVPGGADEYCDVGWRSE